MKPHSNGGGEFDVNAQQAPAKSESTDSVSPAAEAARSEWRAYRNDSVKAAAAEQVKQISEKKGVKLKLSDSIFHAPTKWRPDYIVFHSYEPYIVL